MKIEIFGTHPKTTCWHVLADEGTVGRIQRYNGSGRWTFKPSDWNKATYACYPKAQQDEIHAAVEEKLRLLTIIDRLSK